METLLRWFRERVAEEITPQDIERRLNELAEDGRKPATVNRYRTLFSLVFSLAVRDGKLSFNPVKQVKKRKENNERVRFLEPDEQHCGPRFENSARDMRPNSIWHSTLACAEANNTGCAGRMST
jgi:site-specific recombinase XerD